MIENKEIHSKIIEIIEEKGPSLPIQIAKGIGMSSLFVSAFLSELVKEKKLKMSHLNVGGSKLYLIPGQEHLLENFYKFLHAKEAETFLLLKQRGILKDSEQEPAIRVALRSIRDFAIGFKQNEEIFWRYFLTPEQTAKNLLVKTKPKKIIKIKPTTKQKTKTTFQNPLAQQTTKKQKSKSGFVEKVIELFNKNYKILEEKEYKQKEYNCIIQIRTELGPMNFLTQAKDKKTISETDIKKLLSIAQSIPLPALILYTGKLSKKAENYAQEYSSILKTKRIHNQINHELPHP